MPKNLREFSLMRHGESRYNAKEKQEIPGFKEFLELFNEEFAALTSAHLVQGTFPSPELLKMAQDVQVAFGDQESDFDTPLTDEGWRQSRETGMYLPVLISKPDVIYYSPYVRAEQTLDGLLEGWPELKEVPRERDDRLREQEHGKRIIYGDPRIYCVFNPEYALLYKMSSLYEYRHEGGESLLDVRQRTHQFREDAILFHGRSQRFGLMRDVLRQLRGRPRGNVFCVTHHRTTFAIRSELEDWDRGRFLHEDEHNRPPNCGITVYRGTESGGFELQEENVTLY